MAEPELRQLTILFCDLVGSTELSTRLDPEDLSDVIRSFHQVCEAVIAGAGGHVVKFIGDGVLACFGAPVALDDAVLRGVQAAWDLVDATRAITEPDGSQLASPRAQSVQAAAIAPTWRWSVPQQPPTTCSPGSTARSAT